MSGSRPGGARRPAERQLPGGGTVGAVRVADEVHRPARAWTPTVHELLRFLERESFDGAPRVLGYDDQDREVLTFLPGRTIGAASRWPRWVFSDRAITQAGRWLRQLHDTTASFVPPPGALWFGGRQWRPDYVIGHHDATPKNAVWRTGGLVGFIDWDTAGPATRESDLVIVALSWVPLHAAGVARRLGFTDFGDRRRRLHLLLDAYGYGADRADFGAHVTNRILEEAAGIRSMAAEGDPAYQALTGEAADLDAAVEEVSSLGPSFWSDPAQASPH